MASPVAIASAAALLLASGASAQSNTTVWSTFAFVMYGERTPLLGKTAASLTPFGAQQMAAQGNVFRNRYLSADTNSSNTQLITSFQPIANISRNSIDNVQLAISATTDSYVTGGALAFMQGLYPPVLQTFNYDEGGIPAAELTNGTLIDFPLSGYQYPNIQTLSVLDSNSVWLEGQTSCDQYWESGATFMSDSTIQQTYNDTLAFYQTIWSRLFSQSIPESNADFNHAYEFYDYVSYEMNHNATVAGNIAGSELNLLYQSASLQQFDLNGNLSSSGLKTGDQIRAIGGKTLAAKVLAQFQAHIASGGYSDKLTLMFGSFEPMLAFFALSGLTGSPFGGLFAKLPGNGATMVFELFSHGNDSSSYPLTQDLWVRFLYRNGTDPNAPLLIYPLFGNTNEDAAVKWTDFISAMNQFATSDLYSWCSACSAITLYCEALVDNVSSGGASVTPGVAVAAAMSPVIGGVIGAACAVGIIGLAVAAAMVLGGLRLRRNEKPGKRDSNSGGGFKGPEKLESDRDVEVVKTGAKHERVGSWELGQPGGPNNIGAMRADDKDTTVMGSRNLRSLDDDDDISILGAVVKPHEGI